MRKKFELSLLLVLVSLLFVLSGKIYSSSCWFTCPASFSVCMYVIVFFTERTFGFGTGWIHKQEWEEPSSSGNPLDSASINNNCCEMFSFCSESHKTVAPVTSFLCYKIRLISQRDSYHVPSPKQSIWEYVKFFAC